MRRFEGLVSVVAAAAVSLSIGAVGAQAAPSARRAGSPVTAASGGHAVASASTRQMVTLVTGDHVVVNHAAGGRTEETFLPAAGHSTAYQAMTLDGESYLLPRDAMAGMGSRWVLGDFDISRLAEGRAAPLVRPDAARRTTGYRDVLTHARMAPAAGGYHLKVLTVKGIGPTGHADFGDSVILINLENTELYTAFLFFDGKPIKLQVPVGHYAAIGDFFSFGSGAATIRTVVVPQVAVDQNTTLTVDARTATDLVKLSLPVPTTIQTATFTVERKALRGTFTDSSSVSGGLALTVNPVAAPSIGSLESSAQWQNVAKSGGASYNVLFNSKAIPEDEDFSAGPANLATVDATYASDGPTRYGDEAVFVFTPSDPFSFAEAYPLVRPLTRTEYYSTGTGIAWAHILDSTNSFSKDVEFSDNLQSFVPGTTDDNWLAPPLGPAVPVAQSGLAPAFSTFVCAVCRSTGRLDLDIVPWGDGTPGHLGFAFGFEHSAFSLYRGTDRVASGSVPEGSYAVPSAPAVYRLTFHDQRTTPTWRTSTSTTTAWRFASAATASDLPAHWICPSGTRDCSTLSLLFPRYTLPTTLRSEEYPGATGLTLGFSDDDEVGSVPVDDVHVSVSFDGGHSWKAATVRHQTGNTVLVSYVNPAPAATGSYASLRVSAEDSNGGTVTQTVIDAYAVVRGA